jgi:hypothetical protein
MRMRLMAMLTLLSTHTEEVVAMAALTVRGLDDETKERLRVRAAQNGRSMEAEGAMLETCGCGCAGGVYLPGDRVKVLKQDRRANAGREGTTHVHRSPRVRWR